jgi:hypothetical protein
MAEAMLKTFIKSSLIFTISFMLCGFYVQEKATAQPSDERKAQESLPQSHDNMWKVFGKCKVHRDKKKYTYSIDYTPEVKAMEGKQITVSGFMLPLESSDKFKHFLLSKRTPTCFFCPPGEPNEIVEVFTKKPVKWDEGIVVVTGTMKFTSNPELGLFFQMKDAESVKNKKSSEI